MIELNKIEKMYMFVLVTMLNEQIHTYTSYKFKVGKYKNQSDSNNFQLIFKLSLLMSIVSNSSSADK